MTLIPRQAPDWRHIQALRSFGMDLSTWLDSLEQMSMYEKYFARDELARLPMYHDEARWR